ncbi:hypothetical protein PFICI_12391 [Pestalotiopsis fici W106-1]|uniref:Tryptophan synthase beta chain-like PALP domain-containing protein n=1 Tax=Pestalotiopsis fici (strain W106-1 / CGMCC3.15140) TaxID=1229662 RepID=W3WQM5_PESFW|nr:uncharacterized protein PFICI_12391 [Pestalotiopsis fici W106-1]ETS75447.1 hypothetical protein PFICI_12391 [Pestalotiopsis fici W106-1]
MTYHHHFNSKRLSQELELKATDCVRHLSGWRPAVEEIKTWPEYKPQPLRDLKNTANSMNVHSLFVKDESQRFGVKLASFKALGAPYAVYKILSDKVFQQTGLRPSSAELRSGKYRDITQYVTVCVATDGNQGRGLAYGAKIFGCRCVDYIHNCVSDGRKQAMEELGAVVIRVDGEYEASVARAKEDARMNGWHFVSSTSWADFDDGTPQDVMNAYMVIVEEALSMIPAVDKITHVLICGGVGSIAAAVFLGFYTRFQEFKILNKDKDTSVPRFVVIEPEEADCLFQSARHGDMIPSDGTLHTLMAGLACRAPSPAAWKILSWLSSDFMAVSDSAAVEGMKELATGASGDIPVVCGESSAAGMGVMMESCRDFVLREKLGLDSKSQILIFGLEGATDPEIYYKLVGKKPEDVFAAQTAFNATSSERPSEED